MLEVFFDCAESRQRWLDPYFFSVLTDEKPEERYSAVAGLYRVSPTEIAIGASHARAHSTVAPTTTEWLPSREAFVSSFFFLCRCCCRIRRRVQRLLDRVRFVSFRLVSLFIPPFSLLRFFEFFLTEADDLTMTDGRPIDVECEARKHRLRHRLSVQLHFFPQPPPPALPFCFFFVFFYRTTSVGRSSRRRRRRRGNERARCKHKKKPIRKKNEREEAVDDGRRSATPPRANSAAGAESFVFLFFPFFSFSIYKKKRKRRRVALGVEGRSSSLSRLTGLLPSFSFQPHSFT